MSAGNEAAELSRLYDVLGVKLTAYMLGIPVAASLTNPSPAAQREVSARISSLNDLLDLLIDIDSPETIRAWFVGMNPMLDDDAPAERFANNEISAVFTAARSFRVLG